MKSKAGKARGARVRASRARTRVEARRKARLAAAKNAAGKKRPAAVLGGLTRERPGGEAEQPAGLAVTGSPASRRRSAEASSGGASRAARKEPPAARKEPAQEEKAPRRARAAGEEKLPPAHRPASGKERKRKTRGAARKEPAQDEKAPRRARAREEESRRGEGSAATHMSPRGRRRGPRPRLRLTMLSALLVISLAAMLWVYTGTGVLNVKYVEVRGNERLDPSYIRRLSGIDENTHLLKMDGGKVKDALLSEPYIAGVEISRRFPYTVVITVEEREPQGFIVQNGKHYLVDREGVVLEGTEERPQDMVEIKGLTAPLLYPGRTIAGEEFAGIAALLQSLPAELEAVTSAAGCDQADGLYLESGGTRIIYGHSSELERKNLIAGMALQQLVGRYAAVEYIDVSIPDHPVIKPAT